MAIFRGTGGANEATDLATNQAVIAKEFAEQAANSATQANLTLDAFQDIYLGAFSTAPLLDNDGNALQVGALYFNTSSNQLFIYATVGWQVTATATPASFTRNSFTGDGTQTVFTLTVPPANSASVIVYLNGLYTKNYTISNTTLTFTVAPANGVMIEVLIASTVAAAMLENDSVFTAAIQNNAVTTQKIADGAVGTPQLADNAVTTLKITDLNVTEAKLASNSVTTGKVLDGNITLPKLASNSVDASKIVDGSIGTLELADNAVSTAKLNDLAVTTPKIANLAVTGAKLEDVITAGSVGSATNIPVLSYDAKGRITTATSIQVVSVNRAVAVTTNGASAYDFTGIPAGVKRLTVMFNGVSTNGTAVVQVQIGAGAIVTSGYSTQVQQGAAVASPTTGFSLEVSGNATFLRSGIFTITPVIGNTYTQSGVIAIPGNAVYASGGTVSLASSLDRIRITTANGTDVFDAGAVNITWEF